MPVRCTCRTTHATTAPISGVIGMNLLLLDTDLTPRQREIATIVQSSAESLLTVINDVLDFSKLEAKKMLIDSVKFDLRSTIEEITEMMASQIGDSPVQVICYVPPDFPDAVIGDPGRIRQVLMNLAGNAIKFTEKGQVSIEVGPVVRVGPSLRTRIAVRDTGIGIATDRQETIFESFTQADGSMTRRYGGTGLGLTLTRQLVELMGGSSGMQSEAGVGSEFWVEFDLGSVSLSDEPDDQFEGVAGKRVLIIDSAETSRRMLRDQLDYWGCSVLDVAVLADARSLLEGKGTGDTIDLVFVDCPESETAQVTAIDDCRDLPLCGEARIVPLVPRWPKEAKTEYPLGVVLTKPIGRKRLKLLLTDLWKLSPTSLAVPSQTDPVTVDLDLTVLIAEDNSVNLMVLESMLDDLNCRHISVGDGAEALAKYGEATYNVILMDLQMPVMDGIEATKRIRSIEAENGRRTPIIALTAHALEGDRERCLAAGMDDYLSKPIVRADMIEKLKQWGNQR